GVRLLVDAPLSFRGGLPLEMLDRIRDVDGGAVDAGVGEAFVEDPSGRPDERMALLVLLIAGLLADEDHLGGPLSLSEHALGRAGPEVTGPAALDGRAQVGYRGLGRERRVAGLIHYTAPAADAGPGSMAGARQRGR